MAQSYSFDSQLKIQTDQVDLVRLLRHRAQICPDDPLYTMLIDGEEEGATFDYAEVDRQARAIGALLQSLEVGNRPVLLIYPPGFEFIAAFYGCLYAGAIAVPTQPPVQRAKQTQSLARFQAIVNDARPFAVLTTSAILPRLESMSAAVAHAGGIHWTATDTVPVELAERWEAPRQDADAIAFLQYTSGSTALPKGVMVSHRNLLANSEYIDFGFEHTAESIGLTWLPHFHDMGLINGIIQPLYRGFRCFVMSPAAFLQSPYRWLKAISRYRVTHSGGPNFAYEVCLRRITAEQRTTLDLSSWAVAFNGAEPVRRQTVEAFAEAFAESGFQSRSFYPAYGLAEATLKVTGGRRNGGPVYCTVDAGYLERHRVVESPEQRPGTCSLVGAGSTACGTTVAIVDPETLTRCAADEIGEVWVSGPGVAKGYWNRPEESAEVFGVYLKDKIDRREGPFLRTGDLGFIRNDQLFVTGRIKDLIIIRGLNHYPQDIELTVERSHPALRPGGGAAFSIDVADEERLVVIHEIDYRQEADVQEIIGRVQQAIAENHEVQLQEFALLAPGTLPKTTSGKIQRRLCRSLFLEGKLDPVAHWQRPPVAPNGDLGDLGDLENPPASEQSIAEWLRMLLAARLGVVPASIDDQQSVMRYGLDSLTAIEFVHRIQSTFGIVIPLSEFFESPSIAYLAARIKSRLNSPAAPLAIREGSQVEDVALSFGQQALWFLYQVDANSVAYNISFAVRIISSLDEDALHRAFQALVNRHPALRTTFAAAKGKPYQRVHEQATVSFEVEDAGRCSEADLNERITAEANRPFDLERGPLLRVRLFRRSSDESLLLLVVHHIAVDLWSLAQLIRELGLCYSAEKHGLRPALEPPRFQYADYVRWESEMLASQEGSRLEDYWRRQLADVPTVFELPADRPRPKVQSFKGASVRFNLERELADKLKRTAQEQNVTLYMTLLAALQALLYRYSGQSEFLVGSPSSGRGRVELADIVGYFVNPVVLRADLSGDPSFRELLARVRQTVSEAFNHDGYPLPLLVQRLQPDRDPGRSPLFQVLFVLQKPQVLIEEGLAAFLVGEEDRVMRLGELVLLPKAIEQRAAQFDLSVTMTEIAGELAGSVEYSVDLFDRHTMERFTEHFKILIESLTEDLERPITRSSLLTEAENRLMRNWAATSVDYGQGAILHGLFELQVERGPQEVALVFGSEELTYAELNTRANQLAHWLIERGIGPDVLAGVLMERSLEMVIGLLAILKAGGAYLPIDPHYPGERLAFMIEDARPQVLLTQERFVDQVRSCGIQFLSLDSDLEQVAGQSPVNPGIPLAADHLAYVIYTSGSTGKPKGAMNTHGGICNRLLWMQAAYGLTDRDRVLQKTPFTFDVSVWEFFWPLITGARLVVARPGGHQDSAYLAGLISEQGITTLHFVPSMLQVFLDHPGLSGCRSLRRVMCSGETLPIELQRRFFARFDCELHNLYGPTEAAVDVSAWACDPAHDGARVPIGRAIANIQLHIVDALLQAVPLGVPGELYIAGVGLARGYLDRPELTAERFIPNPFAEQPGARMYRTGDLARYLPGGEIEFLGRVDHQVKIRGVRIELGEIEAVLASHSAVRDVVVASNEEASGDKRLIAYIVPTEEAQAGLRPRSARPDRTSRSSLPARTGELSRRHKLPNGLMIAHDGEIQFNTMDIYREVFEKETYLQHGITLADGDCVFDVGAHIGLFTLFVNQKCRNARVYAFEPIPPTYEALRANTGPEPNVKLFNLGLGDRERSDSFNYYPRMTGVSGRVADPADHKRRRGPILANWLRTVVREPASTMAEQDVHDILEEYFKSEVYECRLIALSDVIRDERIEQIDLLKIDVEESELDVLAGIAEGDWPKIKQIVIEVESTKRLDAVAGILQGHGYQVFIDRVDYGFSIDDPGRTPARTNDVADNGVFMIYAASRQAPIAIPERRTPERTGMETGPVILDAPPGSALSVDELHCHLLQKLPESMLPSAFVLLDRLPLLSSGKVDRQALPAPGHLRQQMTQEYVAPRDDTEAAVAGIFAEVLGLDKVGVEDNFFRLGGHSLLATQVLSRIFEKFKVEIPLPQLFEQSTVAATARCLMGVKGFRPEIANPIVRIHQSHEERLLDRLDQLTDEEVEMFLRDGSPEDRRKE